MRELRMAVPTLNLFLSGGRRVVFGEALAFHRKEPIMSREEANKAVVVRWFTDFWGKEVNLSVVDEIAGPDMLLKYSLHEPRRRHRARRVRAAGY